MFNLNGKLDKQIDLSGIAAVMGLSGDQRQRRKDLNSPPAARDGNKVPDNVRPPESRLRSVIADFEARNAEVAARKPEAPAGAKAEPETSPARAEARNSEQAEARVTQHAEASSAVVETRNLQPPARPPELRVVSVSVDAPAPAATKPAEVRVTPTAPQAPQAPPPEAPLSEAQLRIAEQRKAAEALLLEAYMLEERLAAEATAAQAARERLVAKQGVETATKLEHEALAFARETAERHADIATERKRAEALLATSRLAADEASRQIKEVERRLQEVKRLAEETATALPGHEQQAAEWTARETASAREASEAAARVAQCQAARKAAQDEAESAEARASALEKAAPAATDGQSAIADVASLAARIAEQKTTLTQSVPNTKTG
jgi:hypothetical protein